MLFSNRQWIPGIGIDLITANFNQTTSSQIDCMDEDSQLGNLTNKFDVFTECGSLTPLQMCALFQFFRQTPMYKTSCFHSQFDKFFASKSNDNKTLATPNNSSDQLNTTGQGDADDNKSDTSHVNESN